MRVLILGGSGIGMIAASILSKSSIIRGFLNDTMRRGEHVGMFRKYPVVGRSAEVHEWLEDEDTKAFVAWVGYRDKRGTLEKLDSLGLAPENLATCIDMKAVVPGGYCDFGKGVLIAAGAQLSTDTRIDDHCMMMGNSFLGHDSTMGRFSMLSQNAAVGANVRIGRGVHVGSNATVRENVTIGDFAIVGAGAVVLEDVPEGATVVGNPARLIA